MRCPKCGYISFDHLEQCLKCKKNIKAVSDTLHGTVFNVASPTFLQLSGRQNEAPEDDDEVFADNLDADEEFVDEDLQVLVGDETATEMEAGTAVDNLDVESQGKSGKTLGESIDLEDQEIEIDLSQFEDAEEPEMAPVKTHKTEDTEDALSLTLELPAELSDLSDLAPPSLDLGVQIEKPESKIVAKKDAASLEMDDVDFDLGLGNIDADFNIGSDPTKETTLALDDIDFSETLTKSGTKTSGKKGGAGMDEDLKFDLDLGGLSINK